MSQNFPTAAALKQIFQGLYELQVGQDSPINDKADIRIRSSAWAIIASLMNREVIDSTLQNFILTASRETLINVFGREYVLPIKEEISAVLTADFPATTGTVIDAGTDFVADDTGIVYFNAVPVTAAAGNAALELTCRTPGVVGNLNIGQTLSTSRVYPGSTGTATVTGTTTTGADAEDTEDYRQRLLDIARAPGGGGNSADFRNWAQLQEGVARAYPYSGLPLDDPGFPGAPPERTVYIEADESIDPDGIAPQPLLDATKATIITDADTSRHRQPLGLTNDTLYVESITRSSFYVTITGLTTPTGQEAQVQSEIESAIDSYFTALSPFIQGLDIDADRNDLITAAAITKPVQQVLEANSSSIQDLEFSDLPGTGSLPEYQLNMGEKAKTGSVTYI